MSQITLLPSDEAVPGAIWIPPGPIPSRLRAFGKFPNVEQWLPGDLLLVSSLKPNLITRQTITAQERGGYGIDDARWQHAAVYVGEGYVTEASLHGVRYAPIYPYLGNHLIRLRRPVGLTADDRWRIAVQAAVRTNEKYGLVSIASLFAYSFVGLWTRRRGFSVAQARSVICSQLYSDAYSRVTGRLIAPPAAGTITPAALSATPELEDVNISWLSIPS
jgi:hypothetical protein